MRYANELCTWVGRQRRNGIPLVLVSGFHLFHCQLLVNTLPLGSWTPFCQPFNRIFFIQFRRDPWVIDGLAGSKKNKPYNRCLTRAGQGWVSCRVESVWKVATQPVPASPAGAFVPLSFSRPVCIMRQLDGELIRARITNSSGCPSISGELQKSGANPADNKVRGLTAWNHTIPKNKIAYEGTEQWTEK